MLIQLGVQLVWIVQFSRHFPLHVAAAGISVMGSVDHMSGGTFVVDSSSDSDGNEKSGLVYDVSVVTFAGAANRCAWTHWQALSSPSLCLALAFWVEFFN